MALGDLSVRSKLALIFVSVSFLTFGVGGSIVARDAADALETEIMGRLRSQSRAYETALDGYLRMLHRRSEDFASDGYIRDQMEMLIGDLPPSEVERQREALRTHLLVNKLPLVGAFADLTLVAEDGRVVLSARTTPPAGFGASLVRASDGDEPWCSDLMAGAAEGDSPRFVIAVPLSSKSDGHRLGRLVAWIRPGVWIAAALGPDGPWEDEPEGEWALFLRDKSGSYLALPDEMIGLNGARPDSEMALTGFGLGLARELETRLGGGSFRGGRDPVTHRRIRTNDWDLIVELHPGTALSRVRGMRGRFLGIGAILAGAACALFFLPMRLLMRPLLKLGEAARRLEGGDLATRVEITTNDEFGELGRSFNSMATAVEERTQELARSAEDLRKRQKELSYERDRLQGVISSMRDGLVVLDADGEVLLHNRAAQPLLSHLRAVEEPIVPHHICDSAGANGEECHGCLFDSESNPKSCVVEIDKGVFEVHAMRLTPDASGRAGRLVICHDLTDRIAEDERQIHQERLAVLGEVAAVMAHELNNPLAAISMYNQMLATELGEDSPLGENVQVIQRNVESCKRAIRELLDYATDTTPLVDAVDVHATLQDVSAFLRPLRERAGVRLVMEFGDDPLEVSGDEVQIRQIFVNLIVNAIQAIGSDEGTVTITTSAEENHAVIRIADDGPGIPPEAREDVFRPFFTTKGRGAGTGLGLPTSRRIAEMYGGGVEIAESGPHGSVFLVRLLRRGEGRA